MSSDSFLENNDRRVDVITSLYAYLHNFAWVGSVYLEKFSFLCAEQSLY